MAEKGKKNGEKKENKCREKKWRRHNKNRKK